MMLGKPMAPKAAEPAVAVPAPAPEPKPVVETQPVSAPQPAPEVKKFVQSLPVITPKAAVHLATPVEVKPTESVVVPAVATSEANTITVPETDKAVTCESKCDSTCECKAPAVQQPEALPAPTDAAKVKNPAPETPAAANEGDAAATATPPASTELDSWLNKFSPMQMLLAVVIALALSTCTGIWAIILLGGRRGGLPKETIELINQTLQVWCTHLSSGRAFYGWAPNAGMGGAGMPMARERNGRTPVEPLGNDVIVQSILKENRNLRSDDEAEVETGADAETGTANDIATETEAAAPANRIDKVIWEMKVDDLGTS
jgi:hypothetical protein